jgi:predicted MPP superfamily phosphohydrolase
MRSIAFVFPLQFAFAVQPIGTLLMLYAFWIEPHHIHITQQKLFSHNRTPNSPLRILHLSDLHLERITNRERTLTEYIHQLRPDIILFSGDFLSLSYREDEQAIQQVRQLLQTWQAPLGVYVVSGSPAVDLPHIFPKIIEDLPIQHLQNDAVILETQSGPLRLLGLTCTHNPSIDIPKVQTLLQQPAPPNCFTILLYHSPDLAPALQNTAIDLMLSGHTHGGQVRLPLLGAIFTASLYGRKLQAGRYELNNLTLYIARGIGLEGAGAPRVRFLCPPEIILWEIEKQPSKSG